MPARVVAKPYDRREMVVKDLPKSGRQATSQTVGAQEPNDRDPARHQNPDTEMIKLRAARRQLPSILRGVPLDSHEITASRGSPTLPTSLTTARCRCSSAMGSSESVASGSKTGSSLEEGCGDRPTFGVLGVALHRSPPSRAISQGHGLTPSRRASRCRGTIQPHSACSGKKVGRIVFPHPWSASCAGWQTEVTACRHERRDAAPSCGIATRRG